MATKKKTTNPRLTEQAQAEYNFRLSKDMRLKLAGEGAKMAKAELARQRKKSGFKPGDCLDLGASG